MTTPVWKESLASFFAERARQVGVVPTLKDLCYISGRDPRLWLQPDMYEDLITSIVESVGAEPSSHVLEVGCASGFLAKGFAPRVGRYVGVDLAKPALQVARRLELGNASFRMGDGSRLPFGDNSFDSAFCYDVFTNFPHFADGAGIIEDMLRVVKPGGAVLIGSIPDAATREAYEVRVTAVSAQLQSAFGPPPPAPASVGTRGIIERLHRLVVTPPPPQIVCYYFRSEDFRALGERLHATVALSNIHRLNPYEGFRFNAVYTKPAR